MESYNEYLKKRTDIFNDENRRYIGSEQALNEKEIKVNEILMQAKSNDISEGFNTPNKFLGSKHFFEVLSQVESSKVFKIIRMLPKGGILHAHDTAMLSIDKIIKFTYRNNLWISGDVFKAPPKLIFSKNVPTEINPMEPWQPINTVRAKYGNVEFDTALRRYITLYRKNPCTLDIDGIWCKFMSLFAGVDPIILLDEVWKEYFYNALKEMLQDGVQYLEFRGLLPQVFDIDGRYYSQLEACGLYYDVLQRFKSENPSFIGAKFIFAPLRFIKEDKLRHHLETYKVLKEAYPDFVAGFDLVGQEDKGYPLKGFAEQLLKENDKIPYYFHAGETNWNGVDTDENLIDAVLLGTKRIGHGFAIVKHPRVLEEVRKNDICVEINPLSNQVLKLVEDMRNHPGASLFSDTYPVVISSDDPAFWEATPLSHDFYFAFMGIASAHADLKFLKQLILNSMKYSAMNTEEKQAAEIKWMAKWNKAMDNILFAN